MARLRHPRPHLSWPRAGRERRAGASVVACLAAGGPLAWSALALLGLPGGARLSRWGEGAARPSERARARVLDALGELPGDVRAPRCWFVLDDPTPNAFVVGDALYLHRGLVWDPALPAVLAHELGHLRGLDARILMAACRLILGGRGRVWARLVLGGLAFRLLDPLWLVWMRRGEFLADAYAARLGQSDTWWSVSHRTTARA